MTSHHKICTECGASDSQKEVGYKEYKEIKEKYGLVGYNPKYKDSMEMFDEFSICKPWELDKDKFYIDATPEEIRHLVARAQAEHPDHIPDIGKMVEPHKEIYDKITPLMNGIIGRLTVLRGGSALAKECHEMTLEVAKELDEWINEEEIPTNLTEYQRGREDGKNKAVDWIKGSSIWQLVPNTPRKIMCNDKELDNLLEEARNK